MLHDWQTLPTCREIFHTWSIWDMHISLHPIFCIRMFGDPRTQKKQTSPSGSRTSSGHCPTSARGKRAEEWEDYPLVNVDITNWKIILRVPGKLAISMAVFNGYVELPEGIIVHCMSGTSIFSSS